MPHQRFWITNILTFNININNQFDFWAFATSEDFRQQTFSKRKITLVMTFLGHEAVLKISYQPNIKRFTTQAILVIFVGFCLSYDKHMQIQNKREKDKTIHQDDLESSSDDDCKEEEENSEQSKNYFGYSL